MTTRKTIDDWVFAVEKLLNDNFISCEVYWTTYYGFKLVVVSIETRDWKHEHGRADYLVTEELGGMLIRKEFTWEDGSDCYSANHYYFFSCEE